MRILDSHVHFWRIGGPGQTWPDAGWPGIHRDFLPADLHAEAAGLDPVGAVLVQSQADDRDTDWLLRDALAPAIAAMIAHGLRFDALVQPRHLPVLERFALRWPDLSIVIDHGAKPHAARGELDPWRDDIAALAALPNLWCKLSGLRTQQAAGQPAAALQPYVAHLLAGFGDRLMWGSDWPVLRHAGDGYGDWVAATLDLIGPATPAATARLFEGAARDFYESV